MARAGTFAIPLLVLLVSSPALAWDRVAPGIDYRFERRSSPAQRVHVARVDLRDPHIGIRTTRAEHRGRTASSFGGLYGASLAVNGGFFGSSTERFGSLGLAMADGKVWSTDGGNLVSFLAAGADNRVEYDRGGDPVREADLPAWYRQAVNGRPLLVWDGRNVAPADCPMSLDLCSGRHPRTSPAEPPVPMTAPGAGCSITRPRPAPSLVPLAFLGLALLRRRRPARGS